MNIHIFASIHPVKFVFLGYNKVERNIFPVISCLLTKVPPTTWARCSEYICAGISIITEIGSLFLSCKLGLNQVGRNLDLAMYKTLIRILKSYQTEFFSGIRIKLEAGIQSLYETELYPYSFSNSHWLIRIQVKHKTGSGSV